jgi:hypothetical protein
VNRTLKAGGKNKAREVGRRETKISYKYSRYSILRTSSSDYYYPAYVLGRLLLVLTQVLYIVPEKSTRARTLPKFNYLFRLKISSIPPLSL